MADELTAKQRVFLVELAKLTRETGVIVGGCGCCGSPFLIDATPEMLNDQAGYACTQGVSWISPSDAYDWDRHASEIVR